MTMIPKKSLGQHWLNHKASLKSMVDGAEISPGQTVLEIGPGQGSLTRHLLAAGAHVIAVEKDELLADKMSKQNLKNLEVVTSDILKYDFSKLPPDYKIVANIPYYLTAHLLRVLTEIDNKPSLAELLVQKEVAERVCAKPGNMSLLAVAVQLYYRVNLGKIVPAEYFDPPPKVDSQILLLKRRDIPLFKIDEKNFFKVAKAGFSEKRKKLRSSLSGGLGIDRKEADKLLEQAGVDGNLRAQSLTLEQWKLLHDALPLPASKT